MQSLVQMEAAYTVGLCHGWGTLSVGNSLSYKGTASKSDPKGNITFITLDNKQICPSTWRKTLFLSPKADYYTNILQKIVQNKSCHKMHRNMRDPWRINSPQTLTFPLYQDKFQMDQRSKRLPKSKQYKNDKKRENPQNGKGLYKL